MSETPKDSESNQAIGDRASSSKAMEVEASSSQTSGDAAPSEGSSTPLRIAPGIYEGQPAESWMHAHRFAVSIALCVLFIGICSCVFVFSTPTLRTAVSGVFDPGVYGQPAVPSSGSHGDSADGADGADGTFGSASESDVSEGDSTYPGEASLLMRALLDALDPALSPASVSEVQSSFLANEGEGTAVSESAESERAQSSDADAHQSDSSESVGDSRSSAHQRESASNAKSSATGTSSQGSSTSSEQSGSSSDGSTPASEIHVSLRIDSSLAGSPVSYAQNLTLPEGSSVYDALMATGVSVTSKSTSFGVYIVSIGGLSEKAKSGNSGWMYDVNGQTPPYTCGAYILKDGDAVLWHYTV